MKRIISVGLLFCDSSMAWSQGHYMHEAAEDSEGIIGFVALAVIVGVIYLFERFKKTNNEIKKAKEREKQRRDIAVSVSESSLRKYPDISKFQNYEAWRKGYIDATYDIQNNNIKRLTNKSLKDLIREYYRNIEIDFFSSKSQDLMAEIGYFEHIKHNNQLLEKDGREPFLFWEV